MRFVAFIKKSIYALYLFTVFPVSTRLSLANYRELIKSLPYKEQAFETKRSTWEREQYRQYAVFQGYLDAVFTQDTIKISRGDLFHLATNDFTSTVFSTILWGYPRNMRGNGFLRLLQLLPMLEEHLSGSKAMSELSFKGMVDQLSGKGIGLSTLTKLLYFFGFSLEGHKCLILDQRIIEVLNSGIFDKLSAFPKISFLNKNDQYIRYLQEMEKLAIAEGYKVDQLELFLFQFGNNLKKAVATSE